jgi:hypothetical protein
VHGPAVGSKRITRRQAVWAGQIGPMSSTPVTSRAWPSTIIIDPTPGTIDPDLTIPAGARGGAPRDGRHDPLKKPSSHILHQLSTALAVPYAELMRLRMKPDGGVQLRATTASLRPS